MGKEKTKKEKPVDHDLFFEIIGLAMIIFAVIIMANIGVIGSGMKVLFKILIGDWYFLILIIFLFLGFFVVFKKYQFDFFSLRFNGFLLFLLSLMLLSHSSFYSFSLMYGDNAISGMWNIYMKYTQNINEKYIFGGGLIGGVIYQFLYFLFGEIGSVLIIILLLMFSIIFMTNNNFFSFIKFINRVITHANNYVNKAIGYFKKIEHKPRKEKISLTLLEDVEPNCNLDMQSKIASDMTYGVNNLLKVLGITPRNVINKVSYLYSKITLEVNNEEYLIIKKRIKDIISGSVYCYYDDAMTIEFENKFKDLLPLKRILLNTNTLTLGVDMDTNPLVYNLQNTLIAGNNNSGIKSFLKMIISSSIVLKLGYQFYLFDINNEIPFSFRYKTYNNIRDIDLFFKDISDILEKRLDLFKYLNVNTILEANDAIKSLDMECEYLDNIIVIINRYDELVAGICDSKTEGKIVYFCQLGQKVGIHIWIVNRKEGALSSIVKNSFPNRLAFKTTSITYSLEILENNRAIYLCGKGDFIFRNELIEKRMQAGYISDSEFNDIIK